MFSCRMHMCGGIPECSKELRNSVGYVTTVQHAGLELCQLICKQLHHLRSLATVACLHVQQNHFAELGLLFHTVTSYFENEWVCLWTGAQL